MKNNIQFGHSEKAIVLGDGFLCDLNAARIADGGKPVKTQSQGCWRFMEYHLQSRYCLLRLRL